MFAQKMEKKKERNLPRTKAREQKAPQMLWLGSGMESDRKSVWSDSKDNHVWSGNSVIQRRVVRLKPIGYMTEEQQEFDNTAQQIDGVLQQAHAELLANNFTDSSEGYVATYALRKKHYDEGKPDMHPSTAAGYVIESKVNNRIARMEGVTLQETHLLKGTRPDIVLQNRNENYALQNGNENYALLDITASNSIGHVLLKKGNWTGHQRIIYVAELIYPSIDFTTMAAIQLTEGQEEEIKRFADEKQDMLQEWRDSCESNLLENQNKIMSALNNKHIVFRRATKRQEDTLCSNFRKFGIQLYLTQEGQIMGAVMEGFSLGDDALEWYSVTDMNRKAQTIINAIEQENIVGMGVI